MGMSEELSHPSLYNAPVRAIPIAHRAQPPRQERRSRATDLPKSTSSAKARATSTQAKTRAPSVQTPAVARRAPPSHASSGSASQYTSIHRFAIPKPTAETRSQPVINTVPPLVGNRRPSNPPRESSYSKTPVTSTHESAPYPYPDNEAFLKFVDEVARPRVGIDALSSYARLESIQAALQDRLGSLRRTLQENPAVALDVMDSVDRVVQMLISTTGALATCDELRIVAKASDRSTADKIEMRLGEIAAGLPGGINDHARYEHPIGSPVTRAGSATPPVQATARSTYSPLRPVMPKEMNDATIHTVAALDLIELSKHDPSEFS